MRVLVAESGHPQAGYLMNQDISIKEVQYVPLRVRIRQGR